MTEPRDIVQNLIDRDMTEIEIVDELKKLGVSVTQPTINRIKNGSQRTSYEIGKALERLHEQRAAS